ncbi:MAG: hypothetical protein ACK41W_06800, partial [Cyanobacteriota bacterium]
MEPNDAPSPASSSRLAEALRWMVAHSQSTLDGLTPGSLELAEVLWLASRLPPPAASKRPPRPESLEPPTPHEHPQVEAGIRPGKAIEEKAPPPICPPDPF